MKSLKKKIKSPKLQKKGCAPVKAATPTSYYPGKSAIAPQNTLINRELSWLGFARRVLALAEDRNLPLLERVKFAGIMGMLHDEFAMKRIGGLKRRNRKKKNSHGELSPEEELRLCREELHEQARRISKLVSDQLRPALAESGIPILNYSELDKKQTSYLKRYFRKSVEPILTPLAVDISHPFPLISTLGLNIAVSVAGFKKNDRFVRIKVPANRPRWVPLPDSSGYVPLEQVISSNLNYLFPKAPGLKVYFFRLTRVADNDPWEQPIPDDPEAEIIPGYLIGMVANDLTSRKFAGVVRLQISSEMPKKLQSWLAKQLKADIEDIEPTEGILGLVDLTKFAVDGYHELRDPPHEPVTHHRLRLLNPDNPAEIFSEIRKGDILLHHPYHGFDTSTLYFLKCAAIDPNVQAIKLTIYRTSKESPIIHALVEAARRGKQVAVLVEITARFDEAPNLAWGKLLEREGVHVVYGVERLKTHVKLALVVREEKDGIRRYVHVGTGNYHTVTARLYEDFGILSSDPVLAADIATLFNELTAGIPSPRYRKLIVAPHNMYKLFVKLIRREIRHSKEGRSSGIRAKMNQLQDERIIGELYRASRAGVPVSLNVRGMCCLRAGVPGLSDNIRVFSTLGRFLEHGRMYRFENAGKPEFFIGSADWMSRNLDRRVESIMPVTSPEIKQELENILLVLESDNCSAWDMQPDGSYVLRSPGKTKACRSAQKEFIDLYLKQSQEHYRPVMIGKQHHERHR